MRGCGSICYASVHKNALLSTRRTVRLFRRPHPDEKPVFLAGHTPFDAVRSKTILLAC